MTKKSIIFLLVLFSLSDVFAVRQAMPISSLEKYGIRISHKPGKYDQAIRLVISHPDNTDVYYTTNGEIPTSASSKFPNELLIDRVMAVCIKLSTVSDTFFAGTYVVNFHSVLPVSCIIIPNRSLFDPAEGIYVGSMSADLVRTGNCWRDIEKEAFFEFINTGNSYEIGQFCGLKIFGGFTRGNPEKALRVVARKKYGKKKFSAALFPTKSVSKFKSIILRISGSDYMGTRFQDMMLGSIAKDIGLDYMAYQPSVLFVNGEYWGIHNLREKVDKQYFINNHHADPKNIDLVQIDEDAEIGSTKDYAALKRFMYQANAEDPSFKDSVEKKMDVINFFNYHIFQIHLVNVDYRGNIRFWKNKAGDNKFRWLFYDGDLAFSSPNINFLEKRLSPVGTDWYNPEWSTILLRKIIQNKNYKNTFINQYCFLLSTWLHRDTMQNRVEYFKKWIEPEINRHLQRRNFDQTYSSWLSHVKLLKQNCKKSDSVSMIHLQRQFRLSNPYTLSVQSNISSEFFEAHLGPNKIITYPYSGLYFPEIPVPISMFFTDPEYHFDGWNQTNGSDSLMITSASNSSVSLKARFSKNKLSSLHKQYNIYAIKNGKDSANPWICLIKNKVADDGNLVVSLPHIKTNWKLHIEKNMPDTVLITKDSSLWRKNYPQKNYQIIQIKELNLSLPGQRIYLLDESLHIVDKADISNSGTNLSADFSVYYCRDNEKLIPTAVDPLLTAPANSSNNTKQTLIIVILSISVIFIGALFYFWKKRKNIA